MVELETIWLTIYGNDFKLDGWTRCPGTAGNLVQPSG